MKGRAGTGEHRAWPHSNPLAAWVLKYFVHRGRLTLPRSKRAIAIRQTSRCTGRYGTRGLQRRKTHAPRLELPVMRLDIGLDLVDLLAHASHLRVEGRGYRSSASAWPGAVPACVSASPGLVPS
eukprot:3916552-Pyramimonas_sp.AAC.1